MKETLEKFVRISSSSCHEEKVAELFQQTISETGYETRTDRMGNVYAEIPCGVDGAKKIMITAHSDEPALAVQGFTEDGFVRIWDWSGVDHKVLPGQEVVIHGTCEIPAIIGILPPHLTKPGDKKAVPITKLYADTGMPADWVTGKVKIGDQVTFKKRFSELKNGRVAGCALDNRLSVTMLLELAKKLKRVKLDVDVVLVCTTQEEIGAYGGFAAATEVRPDLAIAMDTTIAEQHGESGKSYLPFDKVCLDNGPIINPKIRSAFMNAAEKLNIKTSEYIFSSTSMTEADSAWEAGLGRPIAVVSIPVRYLHQPVETVDLSVAESGVDMMCEFLMGLPASLEGVI